MRAGTRRRVDVYSINPFFFLFEERLRAVWSLVTRDAALDTEMGRALAGRIAEM